MVNFGRNGFIKSTPVRHPSHVPHVQPHQEIRGRQDKDPRLPQVRNVFMSSVTTWANFRRWVDCYLWTVTWNLPICTTYLGYFIPRKSLSKSFDKKNCLGYFLGVFFTNWSGHPVYESLFLSPIKTKSAATWLGAVSQTVVAFYCYAGSRTQLAKRSDVGYTVRLNRFNL
jgi:hypothetical protein